MEITTGVWLSFGAVVALLGTSAFFSCPEIAIFSLRRGSDERRLPDGR